MNQSSRLQLQLICYSGNQGKTTDNDFILSDNFIIIPSGLIKTLTRLKNNYKKKWDEQLAVGEDTWLKQKRFWVKIIIKKKCKKELGEDGRFKTVFDGYPFKANKDS